METALVSLICVAMLIVGAVTVTFNAFQSVTTVADSLREMEQQTAETRLTEIEASQWGQSTYTIVYEGANDDGYLKTIEIAPNGLITKSTIDTLVFDETCVEPDITYVSGDVYAISYEGLSGDGYLTTVQVNDEGQITDTVIDTLEFDILEGLTPEINRVSGDVYAIAYTGESDDGYLVTVEIAPDGQITDTVIDTLEFDAVDCLTPDIIHISGNIYAIVYTGESDDGYLVTVEIAPDGQITDAVIDTLEFDAESSLDPRIINVTGSIYAIVYMGYLNDGFLKTVEIAPDGQITDAVIDTLEFDTVDGHTPDITHASGNIYSLAYVGTQSDGFVKTVEIAAGGQITDTIIDTLEYDTLSAGGPDIIETSDGLFAIVYMGEDSDGFVRMVETETNGQITDTVIDTFEFDTVYGGTPDIMAIRGGGNSVCLKVINQGEASLTEFAKWDIIIQYENGTATYMIYTTSTTPGSNEWTVAGIYLLSEDPEVFDPGILDPGEQMKLSLNVDPAISPGETVRITVSTPNGVKSMCLVTMD
ncbi:MAG TPA: hypothetical protein G4O07_00070 [Dehalococcoidia bacterium]|nr:hypothetical protein [Dehalococcoidia bacterium]